MRKRGAQLRRFLHDGAQLCVCEMAAEEANLDADAGEFISSR